MPVTITTTSSVVPSDYMNDKANAIYPVFVDNLKYASWISEHVMDNGPDHPEKDYFQMKATGATTYAWSLVSGTLPTGLILSTNGRITGTPTEEGLFEFRVRVVTDVGTEEKDLAITAFPERSRWLRDARLGVTVHWGRFTDPQIKNSPPRGDGTGTTEFQGRVGQFNAASWAQQMESWGAGFIEFSGLWQDSYRNWDSTTVTRYFLHSTRGFMDEIVTAFHARSLKVLCYFPPDYRGNPACQNCSDPDKFLWTDGDGNGNWGDPTSVMFASWSSTKSWTDFGSILAERRIFLIPLKSFRNGFIGITYFLLSATTIRFLFSALIPERGNRCLSEKWAERRSGILMRIL